MKTSNRNTLEKAVDLLRAKMDVNQYKRYILTIMFYKALSELDYKIEPKYKYQSLLKKAKSGKLKITDLQSALQNIEEKCKLNGIFDDLDFNNHAFGSTSENRTKLVSELLIVFEQTTWDTDRDALGDAYEQLLSQFAESAGKRDGEFYTPQAVSSLLTKLVLIGQHSTGKSFSVYDPAMGSGSLLLKFDKSEINHDDIAYYGQEINPETYNITRMNMILHGISEDQQSLLNVDTLEKNWRKDEKYNAVVMNPPYSLHWSGDKKYLKDVRYKEFNALPGKRKADYLFILDGLAHLAQDGSMAVVVPHGVLFRGAAEEKIRKKLIEMNKLDAVIGLPGNLFYSTPIPVAVLVFKQQRENDDVMFIDASREFTKGKKQNQLTKQNVEKIISTYQQRKDVDKYAHKASYQEIKENDFNLNIPRYVDTFEAEKEINLGELNKELIKTDKEIRENQSVLAEMFEQLTSTDENTENAIADLADYYRTSSAFDSELALEASQALREGGTTETVEQAINQLLKYIVINKEIPKELN